MIIFKFIIIFLLFNSMVLSYNKVIKEDQTLLSKLKEKKRKYYIYNFRRDRILPEDLKHVIHVFKKKNLKYKDLIQQKKSYKKGVLPTFLKLIQYTYFYSSISLDKNFFTIPIVFYDSEILISKMDDHLFISLRGSTYNQIDFFHDLILFKKDITKWTHPKILTSFENWKKKLLKNYPMEKILSRKFISTKFKFHKGLIDLYKAYKIYDKVKYILNYYTKIKDIYITGHSMGGAFGNLLILDLYNYCFREKRKCKVVMTSFGAPGCMNSNLSLYYYYLMSLNFIHKYIRVYNEEDFITSTLSKKDDLLGYWMGIMRHINSTLPNNKKSIVGVGKHKFDCSKNFILLNTGSYLFPFIQDSKKKDINAREYHNNYSFHNSDDAYLFSIK